MIRKGFFKHLKLILVVGVVSASFLTFGLLGHGEEALTNALSDEGRVICACENDYQCQCEGDCEYACGAIPPTEDSAYAGAGLTAPEDVALEEGSAYEGLGYPYDQGFEGGEDTEGEPVEGPGSGNENGEPQDPIDPLDPYDPTDPYDPYDPIDPYDPGDTPVEPGPGEEIPGINIPEIPVTPPPPQPPIGPGEEIPGENIPVLPLPPVEEPSSPVTEMPEFNFTPPVIPANILNPGAGRPGGLLNPSGTFIDLENRVRFNVDTEIEGLPPFINMEMIVGVLLAQDNYDFPASVAIAQIIQEGGYGTYGPGGEIGQGLSRLSFYYHNLFGIKGTGTAGSVNMRTFEMTPAGESYFINDNFRAYNTFTESILDRSELLHAVYSDLTEGVTDANTFAWNIGGRWATDINYARSLIRHMVNYDLYRLDEMTLADYNSLLGEGALIHPVPGSVITSPFGWRAWDNAFHRGLDFGTGNYNLPVFASEGGYVTFVGYNICAGNWVEIYHGDGLYTRYMHNLANFVEEGQRIERGQQIALSGTTGNSTGNHLHFEVIINGVHVNPALMLGMLF